MLWVLAPSSHVVYGSSVLSSTTTAKGKVCVKPAHAMKILHRPLLAEEVETVANAAEVAELELPESLRDDLVKQLTSSREALPEGAKRVGGWDVGFLRRFKEGNEIG